MMSGASHDYRIRISSYREAKDIERRAKAQA